jgi:hypothetical protein
MMALLALGVVVMLVAILAVWVFRGGKKEEDKDDKVFGGKVCPAIYAPVCGTNGETYANGCHVPEGISVAHQGECS